MTVRPDSLQKNLKHQQRSRFFWLATLEEYERSKLSIRQFCAQKNLSPSTFYQWKRTLKVRPSVSQPPKKSGFVPVNLVLSDTPPSLKGCQKIIESPPALTLHFKNDISLTIEKGFDAPTLKKIVETISPQGDSSCR